MAADEAAPPPLIATELSRIAEQMSGAGTPPSGSLTSRAITGGRSNQTYRLEDTAGSAWVLRMPPRVGGTPSAHDVAREFRVTNALRPTDVPVPAPVLLCEDESVLGLPFTVAEYVEGRTVQSREDLSDLSENALGATTARLVEALAALHAVDHRAIGLERFGRPDEYAARQIRRWSGQWEIVGAGALSALADELTGRLRATAFRQRSVGIVHGDYRIDNTILGFRPEPRVEAIVDWELSTIGDPVADVAMMCVYRHTALDLVLGAPSAWTSERLPNPDELAAAYETAGGVELVDWEQHLALGYYKLAVISAGIDHRYRSGATHGTGFATAADAVRPLLEEGLLVLEGTT